jgi:hypothetical protein
MKGIVGSDKEGNMEQMILVVLAIVALYHVMGNSKGACASRYIACETALTESPNE